MNDQILIQCKHCGGRGQRSMPFYIEWPVEFSYGDGLEVCRVSSVFWHGKVPLILDEVLRGSMTDNPYKLPKGNVKIGFSGGRTSGYIQTKYLRLTEIARALQVVFANIGREMPETLDFVQECSDCWGVPITWVEFGRVNNKAAFKK